MRTLLEKRAEIDYEGMSAEDITAHLAKINAALVDWQGFWKRTGESEKSPFLKRLRQAHLDIERAIDHLKPIDD
jgi:transposase